MEANELRIGNYYLSYGVDLKQVENLTKGKTLIDFHPIPLTEEWLLKFGFDKSDVFDERGYLFSNYNLNINYYTYLDWDEDNKCLEKYPHIKYVHQLQNLFYALTGEELTIKE